jgi:hypothetical protein
LIEENGWTKFPPRLPEQPIFYPVMNLEYATQIARDWNVRDSGAGYVTRFEVEEEFLQRYPVQRVGGSLHTELWVPAGELDEFNPAHCWENRNCCRVSTDNAVTSSIENDRWRWGKLLMACFDNLLPILARRDPPVVDREIIPDFGGGPDGLSIWLICSNRNEVSRLSVQMTNFEPCSLMPCCPAASQKPRANHFECCSPLTRT